MAEAHAALECREFTTMEIGRSRIILGRVVAMYVEDRFVDPEGPYVKAEELHAIGRMNGLGNYVQDKGRVHDHSPHLLRGMEEGQAVTDSEMVYQGLPRG